MRTWCVIRYANSNRVNMCFHRYDYKGVKLIRATLQVGAIKDNLLLELGANIT